MAVCFIEILVSSLSEDGELIPSEHVRVMQKNLLTSYSLVPLLVLNDLSASS